MEGGAGADGFGFRSPDHGLDSIIDFAVSEDVLVIDASVFGGGLVAGAGLSENQFVSGSGPEATEAHGQFLYDSILGDLYWDVDGTEAQESVQLASLASAPALTAPISNWSNPSAASWERPRLPQLSMAAANLSHDANADGRADRLTARHTVRRSFVNSVLATVPALALGRIAALTILLALVALRTVDPVPLEELRLRIFDFYQRLAPRPQSTEPVVIVDLDD